MNSLQQLIIIDETTINQLQASRPHVSIDPQLPAIFLWPQYRDREEDVGSTY